MCVYVYIYIYIYIYSILFTNGSGEQGSISKAQKMVLDASLIDTQHYKVQLKGKWSNPEKGVAPSPTPLCSSY